MSPEVLIYIQNVKTYFKNNQEARDYFLNNSDEDIFFQHLGDISQKNYDKNGEVMLNKEQFELLRKTVAALTISQKDDSEFEINEKVFIEISGFGKICLN